MATQQAGYRSNEWRGVMGDVNVSGCPFCMEHLIAIGKIWRHPGNPCFFSDWDFTDLDIALWNRRVVETRPRRNDSEVVQWLGAKKLCIVPVEELRSVLTYNAETGVLTWKRRRVHQTVCGEDKDGYLQASYKNRAYKAHRLAWALHYGTWPEGQIDHINNDKKDNRIANLRAVTPQQNVANRPGQARSASGIKGVFPTQEGRWRARIRVGEKIIGLGTYQDKREAAKAYRKAALAAHGEYAYQGDQ